jgi:hypothetical protein
MCRTRRFPSATPGGRRTAGALALSALFCLSPASTSAQQPVREVLSFLMTNQAVVTADFEKDQEAAAATRDTVSRALLVSLATLPISSSSAGFIYGLDPALGTVARASESFGPFFVERSLTAGRNQASLGVTFHYNRYTALDGNDLRDGQFVTIANQFQDEPAPFDIETLRLAIETNTTTFLGNYGLTHRWDVGIAVPLVHLRLDGERVNTYRGQTFLQATASAVRTGLADVALRTKYHLAGAGGTGLAAAMEVRLPTGREEDLLGAGRRAVRLMAIGSVESGRLAGHLNASYTTGGVSNEIGYAAAVTAAASPRVTLVGEIVGRRVEALGRLTRASAPHPQFDGVQTIRLAPVNSEFTNLFGVAGLKWNVVSTLLLNGHVFVPLTGAGLRTPIRPALMLDYSFGG